MAQGFKKGRLSEEELTKKQASNQTTAGLPILENSNENEEQTKKQASNQTNMPAEGTWSTG